MTTWRKSGIINNYTVKKWNLYAYFVSLIKITAIDILFQSILTSVRFISSLGIFLYFFVIEDFAEIQFAHLYMLSSLIILSWLQIFCDYIN